MVLSSFATVFRSFVHTLKTMATPPADLPPNAFLTPKEDIKIDTTTWSTLVLQPGPFKVLSSSSSVVKLVYLKGKGDKEHEQLAFEVQLDPKYQHPNVFIITDRCPKTFESQPSTPSLPSLESKTMDPSAGSESSDGSLGLFKTSSGKARADDRVFISGSRRGFQSTDAFMESLSGSYAAIAQWEFEEPIPLLQAATAIACVTKHSLYYEPLCHQCYWYADMVSSLLLRLRPPACKDQPFTTKQGRYRGLDIRQGDSLAALTLEYDGRWKAYEQDGKLLEEGEQRKLDEVQELILSWPTV